MSEGTAGTAPDGDGDAGRVAPRRRRSRRGLVVGLVAAVVAAGAAAAVALGALDRPQPVAAPTPETVVLPSPTPTVEPIPRQPLSAFADALPSTVLSYALTTFAEEPPLLVAGALEGYRLGYSDGGDGALTVLAGQWPTPEEAVAALAGLTAGAVPVEDGEPASGDVLVAGAPVGMWTLTAAPHGATSVSWPNGTVLLRAIAPPDVARDVYAAYPL